MLDAVVGSSDYKKYLNFAKTTTKNVFCVVFENNYFFQDPLLKCRPNHNTGGGQELNIEFEGLSLF